MINLPHFIEVALLLLVAYLIGCFVGYFLRARVFTGAGPSHTSLEAAAERPVQPAAPERAAPVSVETPVKPKTPRKKSTKATKAAPMPLDAPREGGKDNLKLIKGVGPKIETKLNELGIFHFDQIAAWNRGQIDWVDEHLSFKGRIDREAWVTQARALARGK